MPLRIEALEHLLWRVVLLELDRDHAQPVESTYDGIGVDGGFLDLFLEKLVSFNHKLGYLVFSW